MIVAEQSESEVEAERVAAFAPETLLVLPNRGYAAGVNAALRGAAGSWCWSAIPTSCCNRAHRGS